jgi:hypothetical protein
VAYVVSIFINLKWPELDSIFRFSSQLETPVFPSDLNFRIDLNTLNLMCHKTKEFFPKDEIEFEYKERQIYYFNRKKLSPEEDNDVKEACGGSIHIFDEKN